MDKDYIILAELAEQNPENDEIEKNIIHVNTFIKSSTEEKNPQKILY